MRSLIIRCPNCGQYQAVNTNQELSEAKITVDCKICNKKTSRKLIVKGNFNFILGSTRDLETISEAVARCNMEKTI